MSLDNDEIFNFANNYKNYFESDCNNNIKKIRLLKTPKIGTEYFREIRDDNELRKVARKQIINNRDTFFKSLSNNFEELYLEYGFIIANNNNIFMEIF